MIVAPQPTPRGFTITIFLPDGAPDGIRLIEKTNWTGKAVACTRSQYLEARKRPEFDKPGVYVLFGPSAEPGRSRIYVGEGDAPRTRMNQHLKEKGFWENAILFTSKDDNLNKAHTRYVEARLIQAATVAKRVEVDNGTLPLSPPLSEQEAAFADAFCDEMLLIYPVLGVDAFEQVVVGNSGSTLHLSGTGGAEARGARTGDKFVVFGNSVARGTTVNSMPAGYAAIREALKEYGSLVKHENALLLVSDYVFNSPSAAAAVFLGRPANGLDEWKNMAGLSLKELEAAATATD